MKKILIGSFLFLGVGYFSTLAALENKNNILYTYKPQPLFQKNILQINVLKKNFPVLYKLLILYKKCKKEKYLLTSKITKKNFNKILNSEDFNKLYLWYVYQECKKTPNTKVCKIILKNKPPKKPICKKDVQ